MFWLSIAPLVQASRGPLLPTDLFYDTYNGEAIVMALGSMGVVKVRFSSFASRIKKNKLVPPY